MAEFDTPDASGIREHRSPPFRWTRPEPPPRERDDVRAAYADLVARLRALGWEQSGVAHPLVRADLQAASERAARGRDRRGRRARREPGDLVAVPTVLEIATRAGVSADNVLRVVNGEPVSTEIAGRVQAAMRVLGRPCLPAPSRDVHGGRPGGAEPRRLRATSSSGASPRPRRSSNRPSPAEVGSCRVRGAPDRGPTVAQRVASLQSVFEELADELRHLRREVTAERRDRVDDVALQVDLLRASWQGVDRRLGRIERALARQEQSGAEAGVDADRPHRGSPRRGVPARRGPRRPVTGRDHGYS